MRVFRSALPLILLVICLLGLSAVVYGRATSAPPQEHVISEIPLPSETPLPPTPEPTPAPTPEPTPEPEAQAVPLSVSYRNTQVPVLTDGDYNTVKNFMPNEPMLIEAEEPISALYIQWEYTPTPWTLRCGETVLQQGEHGYHHEFIRLPEAVTSLEMLLPQGNEPWLAEICGFTEGARPDWVQDWEEPWEQADLLVFPTHSDDEFIFLGGLIPYYVDQGKRVQVAYVVRHNGNRYHEMLDSLWAAGVTHYPITSIKADVYQNTLGGAREYYGENYMTSYMTEQIRRFRPQVVVGQAEDGDSGHIVHVFGVMCLKKAVELAGDSVFFPDSAETWGVWDVPKSYLHLYGPAEDMVALDFDAPLPSFDGSSAFDAADRAFSLCTSQYQAGKYQVYRTDSPHDSSRFGLYRSTVGGDREKNDLFENIE